MGLFNFIKERFTQIMARRTEKQQVARKYNDMLKALTAHGVDTEFLKDELKEMGVELTDSRNISSKGITDETRRILEEQLPYTGRRDYSLISAGVEERKKQKEEAEQARQQEIFKAEVLKSVDDAWDSLFEDIYEYENGEMVTYSYTVGKQTRTRGILSSAITGQVDLQSKAHLENKLREFGQLRRSGDLSAEDIIEFHNQVKTQFGIK